MHYPYFFVMKLADEKACDINKQMWFKITEFAKTNNTFMSIAGFVISDLTGKDLFDPIHLAQGYANFIIDYNNNQLTVGPKRYAFDELDDAMIEYLKSKREFFAIRTSTKSNMDVLKTTLFNRLNEIYAITKPDLYLVDDKNNVYLNVAEANKLSIEEAKKNDKNSVEGTGE